MAAVSWAVEPGVAEKRGELVMILRTRTGYLYRSSSRDLGRSWSRAEPLMFSNPDSKHTVIALRSGNLVLLWNNTQNEDSQHYGETLSLTDSDPDSSASKPVVQTFVEGNVRFNQPDNIEIQPKTGIVYVIEDHPFGEIYACLRDGADQDLQSDGCVPMLSVIDPDSEPTGFIFDGTGTRAFLHIQHGQQPASLLDFDSNPVNGQTDDLIVIEGFKTDNVPAQFPAWTVDYLIKLNR